MPLTKDLRVKSNKNAERRHGTSDEAGSGKDLGNFKGSAHSRISAHFQAARAVYSTTTYDPIAAFSPNGLFVWIPQLFVRAAGSVVTVTST